MKEYPKFYIDGAWVDADSDSFIDVINPATAEPCMRVARANKNDVDRAFQAAHAAFPAWAASSSADRRDLLLALADGMQKRFDDLVDAHVETLGIPVSLAAEVQIEAPIEAVKYFASLTGVTERVSDKNGMLIVHEPVGVCALINPWNFPLLQMIGKVAPALAAGCTVVEKPAEITPSSDFIMAEILHEIGLPKGVFNLISGVGSEIGPLMSSHPLADMVSFTGSTRAGISVAEQAAPSVKRVCQELGGKSALIITEDADLQAAVSFGIDNVILNSGQTCDALTRMLVPSSRYQEVVEIARQTAEKHVVGDPLDPTTTMGPQVSERQREMVDGYIKKGIEEGATVITGGPGYPEGISKGAFVRPTVFGDVTPDMAIAREEIFGPVIVIIQYDSEEQAIEIANSSEFGLSSGVWAGSHEHAVSIAKQMRAGQCFIQGGTFRVDAPFGGYKTSGNGREWGEAGLHEYLETKAIIG